MRDQTPDEAPLQEVPDDQPHSDRTKVYDGLVVDPEATADTIGADANGS